MRADIHDGPEPKLQSEAGYIDARPQTDSSTKTSCNARPDHTLGQKGRSDRRPAASGLPRQADYFRTRPDFALGPERDITRTADFGRQGRRSHQGVVWPVS